MKTSYLLLFTTILFSCMSQSTTYNYADGSGNVYRISDSLLEYLPVTPRNSSSGTYSGGNPAKATLTKAEYDSIQTMLQAVISKKEIHIENREMMTGMIQKISGEDVDTYYFRGAAEMGRIEEKLKAFLSSGQ
jgi:hypothetical protein